MVSNVTPKFMKGKYSGQSNGQKPTDVQNGSVYFEVDTGKYYMYDAEGKRWYEQKDNGSGPKPKPEQEKTVDITSNGTVVVEPDAGSVLSKVTANVNVQSGGGECEAMLDGTIKICKSDTIKIRPYGLAFCSMLTEVKLPKATQLERNALAYCNMLSKVEIPNVIEIGSNFIVGCSSLVELNFPMLAIVRQYSFAGSSVHDIYLLLTTGTVMADGNPAIPSTCKIHVPASLIEQYKSATNWSKYASQFVAIEGV